MSRLHVMHLIMDLDIGGSQRLAQTLVTACHHSQFRFSVCALGHDGPMRGQFAAAGVPCWSLNKHAGLDWMAVARLAHLIRRIRPHVLHTHHTGALIYGTAARMLAGTRGHIHTEHSHDILDASGRLRFLQRVLSAAPLTTVCVAEEVRQYLGLVAGIPWERMAVLQNGVDTDRFAPGGANPRLLRELGVEDDGPVVVTVGRLDPLKDQATLIKAFAMVRQRVPNAWLLLVGDGPLRRSLAELASDCGQSDRVVFAGVRTDVERILPLCSVFALSSTNEGLPLVALEAMASGLPLVATSVGGIPQLVEDGNTGLLCPAGDMAALADALVRALTDDGVGRALGANGRRLVETRHSLQAMVAAYEALYRNAAGE